MALSVPLSRFTSRVGGGSAFFVRQQVTRYPPTTHTKYIMNGIGGFLAFAYVLGCIGAIIYIISLAARFVGAHERMADALEKIALKEQDHSKP